MLQSKFYQRKFGSGKGNHTGAKHLLGRRSGTLFELDLSQNTGDPLGDLGSCTDLELLYRAERSVGNKGIFGHTGFRG
jgi:hypothetical protein